MAYISVNSSLKKVLVYIPVALLFANMIDFYIRENKSNHAGLKGTFYLVLYLKSINEYIVFKYCRT